MKIYLIERTEGDIVVPEPQLRRVEYDFYMSGINLSVLPYGARQDYTLFSGERVTVRVMPKGCFTTNYNERTQHEK